MASENNDIFDFSEIIAGKCVKISNLLDMHVARDLMDAASLGYIPLHHYCHYNPSNTKAAVSTKMKDDGTKFTDRASIVIVNTGPLHKRLETNDAALRRRSEWVQILVVTNAKITASQKKYRNPKNLTVSIIDPNDRCLTPDKNIENAIRQAQDERLHNERSSKQSGRRRKTMHDDPKPLFSKQQLRQRKVFVSSNNGFDDSSSDDSDCSSGENEVTLSRIVGSAGSPGRRSTL